jgi:alpha-L-rhamnosidase
VRRTQTVAPVAVITIPSGKTVLDFGQNLVGRLRIRVSDPAGYEITLRHAEVLEHDELSTRPLRIAAATDSYVLRGEGVEVYEPYFTFHGFRYAEIENWPGPLGPTHIEAVVLHTDMARAGWFECSDPLVNRLHENVVQGMRGNFLDIPTDCPQRDERKGWTGDIQVFAPTASFLHDCSGMLAGWLRDLSAEQLARPDGVPPLVVPDVLPAAFQGVGAQAVWADVAVLLPCTLYQRFGDLEVLCTQYPSMRAWGEATIRLTAEGDGLWRQRWPSSSSLTWARRRLRNRSTPAPEVSPSDPMPTQWGALSPGRLGCPGAGSRECPGSRYGRRAAAPGRCPGAS